ncbi:MAG TPA: RING finger protein [Pirellulaceae bacterium]|nr:RING finger protein [Pirellulaceae bacterium]
MHDAQGMALVFALLVVGALVAAVLAMARYQQTHQLLERVAVRFRGQIEPGDFFTSPEVRLKFEGHAAVLRFKRVGKHSHQTIFSIAWPDQGLRCEVYPQDIYSGLRKLLGTEDIEIGSPQFDATYFIAGNSPAEIRGLLTSEVQSVVFRLSSLSQANYFATREIQVKWGGGVMTVIKPSRLSTFESLEQFVSLCGMLFSAAIRTRNTGIEFLAENREPDTAEAQCQVCGAGLTGDLVYCASCETPHHRDCWTYFGSCSTYACGEKRFTERPKPARPAKQEKKHRQRK